MSFTFPPNKLAPLINARTPDKRTEARVLIWLLTNLEHGLIRQTSLPQVKTLMHLAAGLLHRHASGKTVLANEWRALNSLASNLHQRLWRNEDETLDPHLCEMVVLTALLFQPDEDTQPDETTPGGIYLYSVIDDFAPGELESLIENDEMIPFILHMSEPIWNPPQ